MPFLGVVDHITVSSTGVQTQGNWSPTRSFQLAFFLAGVAR